MNASESLQASRAFASENLTTLCVEVLAWKDGSPPGPHLAQLSSLCEQFVGGAHALSVAESLTTRAAMQSVAASRLACEPAQPVGEGLCGCRKCLRDRKEGHQVGAHFLPAEMSQMVLCASCGCKRCPQANDHRNTCTGSNLPGQPGSAY
jgi:hypothetical protein